MTTFSIDVQWEKLDQGTLEERACFGGLGIRAGDLWLTDAKDVFINATRHQVHLSAYHLAEWLTWNWWRLRWEPRSDARKDWASAHRLSTIGGGYVWPNLTIFSDGERVAFYAKQTRRSPVEPIQYIVDEAAIAPATAFERCLDDFFALVQSRLRESQVPATNFDRLWEDLKEERADPAVVDWRRLEAILGYEPDEAPEGTIIRLQGESGELGRRAIEELAAGRREGQEPPGLRDLRELASQGIESRAADQVQLTADIRGIFAPSAETPAWVLGARAARALRQQEGLGEAPLTDHKLASLCAVNESVLQFESNAPFSFALKDKSKPNVSRIVLRKTGWMTSRRFELARILGDRLSADATRPLFPATRSYTYRQKWQRSFAAELLCPYDALKRRLEDDLSIENSEGAAQYFNVSDVTVRTLLANHGDLPRGEIDATAAAA